MQIVTLKQSEFPVSKSDQYYRDFDSFYEEMNFKSNYRQKKKPSSNLLYQTNSTAVLNAEYLVRIPLIAWEFAPWICCVTPPPLSLASCITKCILTCKAALKRIGGSLEILRTSSISVYEIARSLQRESLVISLLHYKWRVEKGFLDNQRVSKG